MKATVAPSSFDFHPSSYPRTSHISTEKQKKTHVRDLDTWLYAQTSFFMQQTLCNRQVSLRTSMGKVLSGSKGAPLPVSQKPHFHAGSSPLKPRHQTIRALVAPKDAQSGPTLASLSATPVGCSGAYSSASAPKITALARYQGWCTSSVCKAHSLTLSYLFLVHLFLTFSQCTSIKIIKSRQLPATYQIVGQEG